MRKIISSILVLTMVLSLCSFSVSAEHWAQDAIDYVLENGHWIASTPIEPDRAATRAETASLFARILDSKIPGYNGAYTDVTADNIYAGDITSANVLGLMKGYDGLFRPNDTVTREELACILDRAAKMTSDEYIDRKYMLNFYKDDELISDWASQSVQNASYYVLMKGKGYKMFDPQGTATIAEVATVVKAIADLSELKKSVTATSSVRDITGLDNIEKDFSVIQSGGFFSQNNMAGFGLMARFDGNPGEIYIQRNHPESAKLTGLAHNVVVARVIDPNGDMIARVNMAYKEFGTMEKIIKIENGVPGIYRIEFPGGSEGDIATIGVKNPVSWGVYGMSAFNYTNTTPNPAYLWAPWKASNISIGVTYGEATISSADGERRYGSTGKSTNKNAARVEVTNIEPDSVYRIDLTPGFTGTFGLLCGSRVMCPTPEMAEDLKGGYIWYEDEYGAFQFRGPLQVRARKRMVEIYNEMNGDISLPDSEIVVPEVKPMEEYDNVKAEGIFWGKYFSSMYGVRNDMYRQIMDPSNAWFGNIVARNSIIEGKTFATTTWEEGFYAGNQGYRARTAFVGAITINAETNSLYANPILIKRAELWTLARIVQQEAEGLNFYYDGKGRAANPNGHGGENFDWGEQDTAFAYRHLRNFLPPETRVITDNGMIQQGDWVKSHSGQGASNQAFMCMEASLDQYLWTMDESFLQQYEDSASGASYPSSQPGYIGQISPLGFFSEGYGFDGANYGVMSANMWFHPLMEYLTEIPEEKRNPEKFAKIMEGNDRAMKWISMFYMPAINGFLSYRPNIYTGREPAPHGSFGTHAEIYYMSKFFPIAKRVAQVNIAGTNNPITYDDPKYLDSAPSQGLTDYQAYNQIKKHLASLDDYTGGKTQELGADVSNSVYKLHHLEQQFDDSEIERLPFELLGDYNIIDPEGGAIGLKHKGIYLMSFYSNDVPGRMAGVSWYPSAPIQVYDEYFGTVLCSMKPLNYQKINAAGNANYTAVDYRVDGRAEEVYHTGIIGTVDGGSPFLEGKGTDSQIKWFDDKSFEIRGLDPWSSRYYIWEYYMTDEGYEFRAGLDMVTAKDDLWVQFACVDPQASVADAELVYEGNTVSWNHQGKKLSLTWDAAVQSKLIEKAGSNTGYKFLLLKLTPEMPMVSVKMTRDVGDYVFKSGIEYNFQ